VRILVAGLGTPGHSFPLVPLALALRDAGHEVTFATGPDVRDGVAAVGLDVVVAGGSVGAAFGRALARHRFTERPRDEKTAIMLANEVFGRDLPCAVAADLLDLVGDSRPDLVVAETGNPGAALVAAHTGIPCVTHSFGRRPPSHIALSGRVTSALLEVADEIGVTPLAPGAPLGHTYLDICPPSMQAPPAGDEARELPLRPTGWNPPMPDFTARSGRRRWVYLTLGTAMGDPGVLRAAVGGLTRLDLDVLVAGGSVDVGELAAVAGSGADRVRVEPFVPQADLLAGRVGDHPPALVVHHGGSGTTLAAAAAGIPQVFLPQGADQFVNADAVTALAVGRALVGADGRDPAALVTAAEELLADAASRAAARALAAEIAGMPSPSDVAARVQEWAVP